jgi:formate hydrogenlyase subunit 3/multisubunit Na+/H+ antiporter MnhD subunit
MVYLFLFSVILAVGVFSTLLVRNVQGKIFFASLSSICASIIIAIPSIQALSGHLLLTTLEYSFPFGSIPLQIDALSAWFILIAQLTLACGMFYGMFYMRAYQTQNAHLSLHVMSWLILQWSLAMASIVQHLLSFLIFWELITLSAFILVIWEHGKSNTIKAGLNYLIQSHISVAILTVVFLVIQTKTGMTNFEGFRTLSKTSPSLGLMLFILMFAAFSLKSGFIPFHTWLPYAHPAAPAHVSGVMSGVIIKMGLYGILRFLLLYPGNMYYVAWIILGFASFTAFYGVIHSSVQRNLKTALAYSSIENIGLAGIGIGLGALGLASGKPFMVYTGFGATLIHILVHAMLKPSLFFCAGTIYQLTHKLDMEQLGGLNKQMPRTAGLFSLSSLAISGLPPFGAFITEFLVISGLVYGISILDFSSAFALIFVLIFIAFTSGTAVMSFSRMVSIIFSGSSRSVLPDKIDEHHRFAFWPVIPLLSIALLVGCFPSFIFQLLTNSLELFLTGLKENPVTDFDRIRSMLINVGFVSCLFVAISVLLYRLRKRKLKTKEINTTETWGCAYSAPTPRIQYTAYSFSRGLLTLFPIFFKTTKKEAGSAEMFAPDASFENNSNDRVENIVIDTPIKTLSFVLSVFGFIQNGKLQSYIMYGLIFMLIICVLTLFGIIA